MWRTRVDIPEFTRCCFCIPLRYGIITWAYIKVGALISAGIMNTELAIELDSDYDPYWDTRVFIILICVVLYLDIISTIFCIVVGHLKHRRGLTLYCYVSLGILIAYITVQILFTLVELIKYHRYVHQWARAAGEIFMTFVSVSVQVYILFLVRSEILKLSAPPNLRFVNHDAEQGGKGEVVLEERENTKSRTGDDAFAYTY